MSSTFLRRPAAKRSVAMIGAGAMMMGTFGFLVTPANAAPVRDDLSATCEGLEDSPFLDISGRTQEAQDAIGCLFNYDITQGRAADEYAPEDTVSRQEMAIFIARQVQYVVDNSAVDYTGPTPTSDYSDRDQLTAEGQAAVDLLTDLGVVTGNADGTYGGDRAITRAEMAVFIDRVQDVIAAEFGEGARYNPEDADAVFTDIDDSDFFADEVYSLQSVGIVQGTGTQNYSPDAPVIRNDMAFFIMRHLDENIVADRVESLVAPGTNETFAFGPDAAETLELDRDDADDSDTRSFSAMGLNDDLTYRVTLVEADLVDVDEDGVVTFTGDDAPNGDLAAVGAAAAIANIEDISNGDVDAVNLNTATAEPVDGTILVTVEGNDDAGSVIPVVYVNGAPGNEPEEGGDSPRLELDANGAPVEPFGIAGLTTFTNPEAASAPFATSEVTDVDKDGNTFDLANGSFYNYDANDEYYIGGVALANQVTQAEFEAELSVGDSIDGDYSTNPAFVSEFNLTDETPAELLPPVVADVSDSTVTLTLNETGLADDAQVRVYGKEVDGNAVDTDDAVLATATEDQDGDLPGFQIVLDDLDQDTDYIFAVTQTVEAEESEISDSVLGSTNPTEVALNLESASLEIDVPLEGLVDTGDVIVLTFDDNANVALDLGDVTLAFTDSDGDTILVTNDALLADDFFTSAAIVASDEDDDADNTNETVTVTLAEVAEDRNVGGDDEVTYPLTLTAVDGIESDTFGDVVLGNDVTVGDDN